MLGLVLGRVGIDHHAANRVLDLVRVVLRDGRVIMRMTLGGMSVSLVLMIVFGLAGHFHASSASKLARCLFCAFQPLEGQGVIGDRSPAISGEPARNDERFAITTRGHVAGMAVVRH